jgi:hypothetical protein
MQRRGERRSVLFAQHFTVARLPMASGRVTWLPVLVALLCAAPRAISAAEDYVCKRARLGQRRRGWECEIARSGDCGRWRNSVS